MEAVNNPLLTSLLIREWHEKAQVNKPTAMDTTLRYSGAHGCERQMSYYAFGFNPTEPVDAAGAWVMGVGTVIHELVQEAIGRKYPNAEFEVASKAGEYVSGSCDAFIPAEDFGYEWTGGNVLFELKTMGTYSFDSQVGIDRMRGKWKDKGAEGPKRGAITQAGMNALGIEEARGIRIDTLILGSITFEAISKQKAKTLLLNNDILRVSAEFHIPREEWEPLALAELARLHGIGDAIKNGYLAPRLAIGDDGRQIGLDPFGRNWQCDYCSFRSACVNDGDGMVWVNDSSLQQLKDNPALVYEAADITEARNGR
jgi:hypothetical protein